MPHWGTVSLVELVWTLLALAGAVNHWRLWSRYRARLAAVRADPVPRPVAACLASAHRRTEAIRLGVKLAWMALGLAAMTGWGNRADYGTVASLVLIASLLSLDVSAMLDVRDMDDMERLAARGAGGDPPDPRHWTPAQLDGLFDALSDGQLRRLRLRLAKRGMRAP